MSSIVTDEFKAKVIRCMLERKKQYGSNAKHAVVLGINASQYSRIANGDHNQVISDQKWISIARILEVPFIDDEDWVIAKTDAFNAFYEHLEDCHAECKSEIICDLADVGKTEAAKAYARKHGSAVRIDCSQYKSKQLMVRAIARAFGVDYSGTYKDVYSDLTFYLRVAPKPMVILDEAGDLQYDAFLELKALWNASEGNCAWVMMGADGLEEKFKKKLASKKVGYAENFRRYGSEYIRVSPKAGLELEEFKKRQMAQVALVNGYSRSNLDKLWAKTRGSLTLVKLNIIAERRQLKAQRKVA